MHNFKDLGQCCVASREYLPSEGPDRCKEHMHGAAPACEATCREKSLFSQLWGCPSDRRRGLLNLLPQPLYIH